MKIAVASEGKFVCAHFGHCEGFEIYETQDRSIIGKKFVLNPGHRPGFLPGFLKELDVDVIIAGGMGGSAQQLFVENGIDVYVGVEGLKDDAINKFIDGNLHSTNSICEKHEHEGDCH